MIFTNIYSIILIEAAKVPESRARDTLKVNLIEILNFRTHMMIIIFIQFYRFSVALREFPF